MIDTAKVTKAVVKRLGCTEEEIYDNIPIIKAACEEMYKRLVDTSFESDGRVLEAAVGLSIYRLVLNQLIGGQSPQSYKIGDISVTQSPSLALERAALLRDEMMLAAAELFTDNDFLFMKV